MWKLLKSYIADLGYWWFIVVIPVALDVVGIYQLVTGNQFLRIPSWILLLIALLLLLIIPFIAYRKIYLKLENIESRIRLKASPGFMAINHPLKTEPPLERGEASINTTIYFEIWADIDIHTAKLVLNVVGIRNLCWRRFWRIFLPKSKRLLGIRIEGQDTPIYRKQIKHSDMQPFNDKANFKWRGERGKVSWGDSFILELALDMGSPKGIWKVVIDPELYERGATTPL